MTSAQLYDAGFALGIYDIARDLETWRYRDETFRLPVGSVATFLKRWGDDVIRCALIEEIRVAANEH